LNACDGDEDTPPLIDEQVFLNKLRIYEPLEDQQAFVEEFLESSKQINDELRKMMLQRKREIAKAAKDADKPQKEKKPRQIKSGEPTSSSANPPDLAAPVPSLQTKKVGRTKKAKVTSTEDALVNELVQLAEGVAELDAGSPLPPPSKKESAKAAVAQLIADVPKIADPVKETKSGEPTSSSANPPDLAAPVPSLKVKESKPKVAKEDKPKSGEPTVPPETPSLKVKESKPKAAKEEKPKAAKEEKPKAVKEEKPKAVKETKPKTAKEEKPKVVVEEKTNDKEGVVGGTIGSPTEEEEEELQVSIFNYEGQQYLIDDLNNVYDFTSQDKIGTLVDQIIVKSGEP